MMAFILNLATHFFSMLLEVKMDPIRVLVSHVPSTGLEAANMLYDTALLMCPELEATYVSLLVKLGNDTPQYSTVEMDAVLYNEAIRLLGEVEQDGIHINNNLAKLDAMAALLSKHSERKAYASHPSRMDVDCNGYTKRKRELEPDKKEQKNRPPSPNHGPLGIPGILRQIASYGSIVAAAALASASTIQHNGVPLAGVRKVVFDRRNSYFTQTAEGRRGISALKEVEEVHLNWFSSVLLPRMEMVRKLILVHPQVLHFEFPGLQHLDANISLEAIADLADSMRSSPGIRFFKIRVNVDLPVDDNVLEFLHLPNVENIEMYTSTITHGIPWSSKLQSVLAWGKGRANPPLTPDLRLFKCENFVLQAENVRAVLPSLEHFEGRLVTSRQLETFPVTAKVIRVTFIEQQPAFHIRDDTFAYFEKLTLLNLNRAVFTGFHLLPLTIRYIMCYSTRQGLANLTDAIRNGLRPKEVLFMCDTDEVFTREDVEPLVDMLSVLVDNAMEFYLNMRGWIHGLVKVKMGQMFVQVSDLH